MNYLPAEREREHLEYLQAIDRAFAEHCRYMARMYTERGALDLATEWEQQGEAANARIARREPS